MPALISRRRLAVAGALATLTVGAAGGAVLASRQTSPSAPAAAIAQMQAAATASPNAAAPRARGVRRGVRRVLGKVTAVSAASITITTPAGRSVTFEVDQRTRVVNAHRQTEQVTSIPIGEVVVVAALPAGRGNGASATPAAPSASTPSGEREALRILDTGFLAR